MRLLKIVEWLFLPLTFMSAVALWAVRRIGLQRLPATRGMLLRVGVLPIRNHFYEPQFVFDNAKDRRRRLTGIEWDVENQLSFAASLIYEKETGSLDISNNSFGPGDAETWYQIIRHLRPKRIIEIGSGFSTRVALEAIKRNGGCEHLCIEPYLMPWLEDLTTVIREPVETMSLDVFSSLEPNDILFIDSSHVIRPNGDVLFEYLTILPILRPGVVVHIHDIFSPNDYPREWMTKMIRLWNEQYLLEAFLTHNQNWKVLLAVNMLKHEHFEELKKIAPSIQPHNEPGSFYMVRAEA